MKSSSEDQKTRINLYKKLSNSPQTQHPAILKDFQSKLENFTDIIEIKLVLNLFVKHNIKDKDVFMALLKNLDLDAYSKLNKEDQSFFIFLLTKICHMPNQNPELFDEILKIYKKLFKTQMQDFKEKDIFSITVTRANNLLFAMSFFNEINEEFLNIFCDFFSKNLRIFSDKEYISTLMTIAKLFAYYEKAAFLENKDNSHKMQKLRSMVIETPELLNKIKGVLMNQNMDFSNLVNLAYALSRINYPKQEIWDMIINSVALNMRKLDDSKFQMAVSAITSQNQCKNLMLLTEFKSHFDSRLTESHKNLKIEYFVRCLRAFVSSNISIINNKDASLKLYVDFIQTRKNDFTLPQNIALLYFFAQINYNNTTIINEVIQRILTEIKPDDFNKIEHLTLFFWAGGVLLHNVPQFWEVYTEYIKNINLEFMNAKNIVNNILPCYILMKIYNENMKDEILLAKFKKLRELAFQKVFKDNTPLIAHEGLDLYNICRAMGLNIHSEVLIEISPVDYYIEDFLTVDFNEKMVKIDEITNEFLRIFPGEGKPIVDMRCEFNTIKDIEEFIDKTKQNALLIEIQGPTHYILEETFEKGASISKGRILRSAGFKCLVMKYSLCKEIGEIPNIKGKIKRVLEIFKKRQDEIKAEIKSKMPFPIGNERYFY